MKIELESSSLQHAIKKLLKVKKVSNLVVLEHVLVEALDRTITITKTNLDVQVKINLYTGTVLENGKLLLSPDTLKTILKIKSGYITITDAQITAGNKTLKFDIMPLESFPISIAPGGIQGFSTSQKELLELLAVQYASSHEDNRPVFNAVFIDKEMFVATDTHRLATKRINFVNSLETPIIIPIATVKLLSDYLDKKSGNIVSCNVDDNNKHVTFILGDTEITSRLVEGTFPNFRSVMPDQFVAQVEVNTKEMLEELEFVQDTIKSNTNKTVLFKFENGEFTLVAKSVKNEIETTINSSSNITGDGINQIAFNHSFLVDALKQVVADKITMCFSSKFGPVRINDDIILPVRIG